MYENLKGLVNDETFAIADLLRKLDSQAHTVKTAGQKLDAAKRDKIFALTYLNEARSVLTLAEANAALSMPPDATNEQKRKAYIVATTSEEAFAVTKADNNAMILDSAVGDAAREHQFQQDILNSLYKKADLISAAIRFLSCP
jgi:hypothetical protein